MFNRIFLTLLAPVFLSGCANLFRSTPAGCDNLVKPGAGSISVAGITIPTGSVIPVKIGNATYTPQQIQRLTDSAQQMEQYRLGQCSVLSTLEGLRPQPVDKIAGIAGKIAQMNLDMQKLFREVPETIEPEKQVQNAEKAAIDIQKEQKLPQISGQRDADGNTGIPESPAPAVLDRVTELKGLILELTRIASSLRDGNKTPIPVNNGLQTAEIVIVGFASGSHEMTTRMKANLLADVSEKLRNVPQGRFVALDVLGYSDTIGQNDKNAVLALRRAQTVAGFLTEQQALPRARLRSVASAGAIEVPPFGRQVRILVNSIPYAG